MAGASRSRVPGCTNGTPSIYRTSFVVEGERYFSLFDDAMISRRYASHLAGGHGLVWNPSDDGVALLDRGTGRGKVLRRSARLPGEAYDMLQADREGMR
jgi:hypothetical protein